MCRLCGGAHDASLIGRPAHRLAGHVWQGAEDASAAAMPALLAQARAAADAASPLWRSPIVCLTWSFDEELRHFAGFALDEGAKAPGGLETVDLPELEFVSRWHGPGDGAVVMSYAAMFELLPAFDRRWSTAHFHHREEYAPDAEPDIAGAMRLMLPVAA